MARGFQSIRITGMQEYLSGLDKAISILPDKVKEANLKVAKTIIVPEAQSRARSLSHTSGAGNPTRPGSAVAGSIEAREWNKGARIVLGAGNVPQALGHEFGSIAYPQFPAFTGTGEDAGYFLYPAIRDTRDEAMEIYHDAVIEAVKDAYPD